MTVLKEEILNLAISGKLNTRTQYSSQTSLDIIIKCKEQMLNDKSIKQDKIDETYERMYSYFNIPDNWTWVKIGDLVTFNTGLTYDKNALSVVSQSMIRVLRGGNIGEFEYFFKNDDVMISSEFVKDNLLLRKNQLILPAVSSLEQTGKLALVKCDHVDTVAGGFVLVATPVLNDEVFSKYLFYAFNSKFHRTNCRSITKKSGQAFYNLPRPILVQLEIPLPPIEEMAEVVASIERGFRHIDQLEAKLKKKEHLLDLLPQSVVDAVASSETEHQLKEQLEFVIENFESIFQTPESIQDLRNVILQLAIEGKLVQQNPTDEPASELLKKIKAEREQLVREKKIKKPAVLEPISEEEIPFEIPESWEWVRLCDIAIINMGQSPDGGSYNESGIGVPLINGPVEFNPGHFAETKKTKFTTEPTKMCDKGDILICVRGATTGKTNIAGFDACIGRGVASIKPIINHKYVHNFMVKMQYDILTKGKGSTFPNFSKDQLEEYLFALPPLKEQGLIVEKINSLSVIIDQLEKKLRRKSEIIEMLGTV